MDGPDNASAAGTAAAGPVSPAQLRGLYTSPPGEFVPRRRNLVAALRASGDRQAARDAAALRKPSTAAWLLNLLADDGRTAPEMLELAGEIAAAVAAGERADLRTLAAAQRILVTDVLERATELAAGSDRKIPAAVREVLEAAVRGVLTDPSTAAQLFTGVLVELSDGDGAEELPELAIRSHPSPRQTPAAPGTAPQQRAPKPAAPKPAAPEPAAPEPAAPRSAEPGSTGIERAGHLRSVREAGAAVRAAERTRSRRQQVVRELSGERDQLTSELSALAQRLSHAEQELLDATARVADAMRALRQLEPAGDA